MYLNLYMYIFQLIYFSSVAPTTPTSFVALTQDYRVKIKVLCYVVLLVSYLQLVCPNVVRCVTQELV